MLFLNIFRIVAQLSTRFTSHCPIRPGRARDLQFDNLSCVMCHESWVAFFFFSERFVSLVGGGSGINGATPSSFRVEMFGLLSNLFPLISWSQGSIYGFLACNSILNCTIWNFFRLCTEKEQPKNFSFWVAEGKWRRKNIQKYQLSLSSRLARQCSSHTFAHNPPNTLAHYLQHSCFVPGKGIIINKAIPGYKKLKKKKCLNLVMKLEPKQKSSETEIILVSRLIYWYGP